MDPSATKNSLQNEKSSTQNPESQQHTNTTRLLYLSSEQLELDEPQSGVPLKASITYSPTHKIWIIPTLPDEMKQYRLNLRNLNIFHTWPSVTSERKLVIEDSSNPGPFLQVTIPVGNWDAYSLGAYITAQCKDQGSTVTFSYDSGRLGYLIDPPVNIQAGTTCQDLIGFPDGYTTEFLYFDDCSLMPLRMSGPTRIHVQTNLSLYTLPSSGRLGTIPVDVNYGELLSYFDNAAQESTLCMEHHLNKLEIHLLDQDNNELTGYETIPWGCIISLESIDNGGFISAIDPILRPITDKVTIES